MKIGGNLHWAWEKADLARVPLAQAFWLGGKDEEYEYYGDNKIYLA
jgi:hypothetical protein